MPDRERFTLDYTPRRIASLQPSATVILDRLGALARVVACTRHCAALCPDLHSSKAAVVEDSWTAQAEQIKAVSPDLVIASVPYQAEALSEILKAGIRFLALAPKDLDDIYRDVATIAALLRVPEQGENVIRQMQEEIDAVSQQALNLPRPRIFCEEWGKPILISQPWISELVNIAGGEFIGTPASAICADGVRVENPDVIVFAWCGAGDRVPAEKLIREREWQNIRAVQNQRVYVIRDDFLTTPAPTLITGLRALAHALHPEQFPVPVCGGKPVMRSAS